jgi:hypothetical protein
MESACITNMEDAAEKFAADAHASGPHSETRQGLLLPNINSVKVKPIIIVRRVPAYIELNDPESKIPPIASITNGSLNSNATRICTSINHNRFGSPYPKNIVPYKWFRKDPDKAGAEELYKMCWHCRRAGRQVNSKRLQNKKQLALEAIRKIREENHSFGVCQSQIHTGHASHPYDQVPVELFRKIPIDPKSELFANCLECRNHIVELARKNSKENLRIATLKNNARGLFTCILCKKAIAKDEMGVRVDGTMSSQCNNCITAARKRSEMQKRDYIDIKTEIIIQNECSCERCKKVFLKPRSEDSLVVPTISTYLKEDGNRYILWENKEVRSNEFLSLYKGDLELTILQFDHLTEAEQRERGLLKETDRYVPKRNNISNIRYREGRLREIKKTQLLCVLCHIDVSIERELGCSKINGERKRKGDHVRKLKEKGCSSCGYKNDCSRHFDMDHTDLSQKILDVGDMVNDCKYTLKDVVDECLKCRVLCKHCHRINTNKQLYTTKCWTANRS